MNKLHRAILNDLGSRLIPATTLEIAEVVGYESTVISQSIGYINKFTQHVIKRRHIGNQFSRYEYWLES